MRKPVRTRRAIVLGGAAAVVTGFPSIVLGQARPGVRTGVPTKTYLPTIIAGTGAARRVAANREQAIIQALVAYKNQFTTGIPRQVTIRINNKIITLHGSQAQMSREFKQFVKQQLNASSTGT